MGETVDAKRRRKRPIIIGTVFGAVSAFALAALAAAITVTTGSSFGAGIAFIPAPCDTSYDVTLGAPTWNTGAGTYTISGFSLSGIDAAACSGSNIRVNVLNSLDTSLGDTLITTVQDGAYLLSAPVDAADASKIASAIFTP